ncbi:MAG: ABC transporter permease [Flavisolibacter sp.]|jgi:putative ABC transport system permease protein|nr:ABC transporter permease [Flavisolibacter sp.]
MFRNYIKIAWRNLVKQKAFSILNITGLAIGLSCFLLIAVYVLDEISYDGYHEKADRIYRINSDLVFGGEEQRLPFTSDVIGATLKNDYPQVEEFVRIYTSNGSKLVKKGNEFITEQRVGHADSTFFDVFTLPALKGDTKSALNEPNTVVVTESTANKYFGSTDIIGKTIETNENNSTLYKITAVIKDIPNNSHFNFDFIFSMDNVNYSWGMHLSHNFHTYLLLKPGTEVKRFEKNLDEYILNYVLPQAKTVLNIESMEEFARAGNKLKYSLVPITDIHLMSDRQFEMSAGGNIQYVYIFSAVALFILLIACINFMNLTTARSSNRAKEVGIRKVLGTNKKRLVIQFLSESTLMAVISMILAIIIAFLVLPLFNDVSAKQMTIQSLFTPWIIPVLIILPFLVGLLAGSYPAFYLSAFQPIQVLKGKMNMSARGGGLRNVLVVFQFATSIILIIGTIVIYRQLNYIQTKNVGFNKDQVLIVDNAYTLRNNTEAFKNDMLNTPGVMMATYSSYLPVSNSSRNDNTFSTESVMTSENGFGMQVWSVDDQYIPTMGMGMKTGRNFSKDYPTDSNAVIINETAAKMLGGEDVIGRRIYTTTNFETGELTAYTIIGVVKNFHFESLKQNIGPLCMLLKRSTGIVSFKIAGNESGNILAKAEKAWKSMVPAMPFTYRFMDESFEDMYRAEQRVGKISLIFSVIAIFIGCLGLFGLAAFIAEQRTKEIGIRKVLGASVNGIVHLLSKDFLKLVLIAFVIAAPFAWWAMHKWLEDFAFRINISWWIFLVAGLIALSIALFTVSFQAIRAALANPVDNLRTE